MIETYSPTVLEAEDPESVSQAGINITASLACNLFSRLVTEGVLWLADASHPPGPIPWFLLSVFICWRSLCPCMCVDSHPMSCEMVFMMIQSWKITRSPKIFIQLKYLFAGWSFKNWNHRDKNSRSWGYYIPSATDRQIKIECIMLESMIECQQWSWEVDSVLSTCPEDLKFGSPESM